MKAPVSLHVDSIVIEGYRFSRRETLELQETFTGELTRLLAEEPLAFSQSCAVRSASGGSMACSSSNATEVGRELAKSVHRSIVESSIVGSL